MALRQQSCHGVQLSTGGFIRSARSQWHVRRASFVLTLSTTQKGCTNVKMRKFRLVHGERM